MIQEHLTGKITEINENGIATIKTVIPDINLLLHRKCEDVEIILLDNRTISPMQRKMIYSLMGEIAEYIEGQRNANTIEQTKKMLKMEFCLQRMEGMERKVFSLSRCDVTTARNFITFLVDFIIEHDIPTKVPLIENCEDIQRYIYACLMAKKCVVCGQTADLHHLTGSKIGMGSDREEVHHLGRKVLPLCRQHHTEIHTDEQAFMQKHHLEPVKLDEQLCKRYKLKK